MEHNYSPLPPEEYFPEGEDVHITPLGQLKHQPNRAKPPKQRTFRVPKRRHHLRTILVRLVIVLLIAVAVYAAYLFLSVAKVTVNPFGFGKLDGESAGQVNILLLGIGDPDHAGAKLSDTTMLISINTKTNQAAMTSIPRDLRVYIPGHGYAKINQANSDGGADLAKQVVENTLGVHISYYLTADFTGLKQAVDAVGGIDINVKDRLFDPEYPCDNNQYKSCGFKLNPGPVHMDGTLALKYARCRKGTCGDDFGRALRQQEVLTAVRQKATTLQTLANPVKLTQLANSAGDNIKTNLSINNMLRLNELGKKIDQGQIIHVVFNVKPDGYLISAPDGSSDLLPMGGSFTDIQRFVANVFTIGPAWSEHSQISLLNGTTTNGVAARLDDQFGSDGYRPGAVSLGNTPLHNTVTTQIIDYSGGAKPQTLAYLTKLLGMQATTPNPPVKNPGYDIQVILGTDYANKGQASSAATTN
jgi:LCP family protein required for cell wall assembly